MANDSVQKYSKILMPPPPPVEYTIYLEYTMYVECISSMSGMYSDASLSLQKLLEAKKEYKIQNIFCFNHHRNSY